MVEHDVEASQGATTEVAPLRRTTLRHADGRRLYVYGEVRGALPPEGEHAPPPGLHQRLDPLTGTWIAVSPARNTRPQTGRDTTTQPDCPLCPGGPEVPFSYEAAVFENRFPSLMDHPPVPPAASDPFAGATRPALGRCEVVLYTEQHTGSFATLAPAQVAEVVAVWTDRSRDLWADVDLRSVLIFENRGELVGATLSHPHGQIYAFDHLPPGIASRDARLREHRAAHGECLSCRIVRSDTAARERTIMDNASFTVAVPFAPRWPFEVHVRARRHGAGRLGDLHPAERVDLAAALREVVLRYDGLFGFELPYMMVSLEAPAEQPDWHLSFEFLPPHRGEEKLKVRASVETAAGMFINDTLPESSAAKLRGVAGSGTDWSDIAVPDVAPAEARS